MDAREALLQRIVQRIARAREAFDQFNDVAAERLLVNDTWNVRDLAGHLAYWMDEAAERIEKHAGETARSGRDLDRINDEVYRKNKRMSYVMLLPKLRAAEERFLSAVRAVPVSQLLDDAPLRDAIEEAGIRHYNYHLPALEEALLRLGG